MIVNTKGMKGTPLMTLDGKKVDKAKRIVFSPQEMKIIGVLTKENGVMAEAKVVPLDKIQKFGKDTIMLSSPDDVKKVSQLGEPYTTLTKDKKSKLVGFQIITGNGEKLGKADDVFFDSETGEVEGFTLSKNPIADMKEGKKKIRVTKIQSVGDDAIVIEAAVEVSKKQEQQKTPTSGSISIPKKSPRNDTIVPSSTKETKKLEDAVGKYLAKNLLDAQDRIIALQGTVITHDLLQYAEMNGLLEQVLENAFAVPPSASASSPVHQPPSM